MNKTNLLKGLLLVCLVGAFAACAEKDPRRFGEFCLDENDCASGLCYDSTCLDPDDDFDGDHLKNGVEKNITGTDYGVADTDGDGLDDGTEVGSAPNAPTDADGDGIHDALESILRTADPDKDCIPDQLDANNDVPDVDAAMVAEVHCIKVGVCSTGFSDVTATCDDGVAVCDYSAVASYEAAEATCDGSDNDCDGKTDEDLTAPDEPECLSAGVCAGQESVIFRICKGGTWQCEYSAIDAFEKVESSCDGLDNNCDGVDDDGLVDQDCFNRNEYGQCAGKTACTIYEGVTCVGQSPTAEICNEIDDNCNGLTDEGLIGVECLVENVYGTCDGVTVCDIATGGTLCSAATPVAETCDSIDNNCDGETDEEQICDRTSTLKVVVHGAVLPPVTLVESTDVTGYAAISGATVNFFADYCPEAGVTETVPDWTGISDGNGVVLMPVQPGNWCIQVIADGYQTLQSYTLAVPSSVYLPLNLVLLMNGMTSPQLSLCGRVVEAEDYVTAATGSTDIPVEFVPISNALVTLTGVADETGIATTMSDSQGYWCLYGLPSLPGDGQVLLTGTKDLYYPTTSQFTVTPNVLYFQTIMLSKMDTTETSCLYEGFEKTSAANGWGVVSGTDPSVVWGEVSSMPCIAQAYSLECGLPFANEIDSTTAGTLLCQNLEPIDPACVPTPGSILSASSGNGFAWFGNTQTCSYSAPITACSDVTTRVDGSLVSPWINATNAWTLYATFMSAWEVESNSATADVMYVEAQTSPMSETNSWSQVALVKDLIPVTPVPAHRSSSVSAWTSGGEASAPTWNMYRVDLAQFTGEWMRIRFRFDSMDENSNYWRGWQVDEVNVSGIGCQTAMAN